MSAVHQNYIKAQRLMIFLTIAGFVYFFLSTGYNNMSAGNKLAAPMVLLILGAVMAYLLGKGYYWMKYVMLVLFLTAFAKPSAWTYLANLNAVGIFAVVFRMGINVWIIWLLFKVPNQTFVNDKGPDLPEPL